MIMINMENMNNNIINELLHETNIFYFIARNINFDELSDIIYSNSDLTISNLQSIVLKKNKNGNNVLMNAVISNNIKYVEWILNKFNDNIEKIELINNIFNSNISTINIEYYLIQTIQCIYNNNKYNNYNISIDMLLPSFFYACSNIYCINILEWIISILEKEQKEQNDNNNNSQSNIKTFVFYKNKNNVNVLMMTCKSGNLYAFNLILKLIQKYDHTNI